MRTSRSNRRRGCGGEVRIRREAFGDGGATLKNDGLHFSSMFSIEYAFLAYFRCSVSSQQVWLRPGRGSEGKALSEHELRFSFRQFLSDLVATSSSLDLSQLLPIRDRLLYPPTSRSDQSEENDGCIVAFLSLHSFASMARFSRPLVPPVDVVLDPECHPSMFDEGSALSVNLGRSSRSPILAAPVSRVTDSGFSLPLSSSIHTRHSEARHGCSEALRTDRRSWNRRNRFRRSSLPSRFRGYWQVPRPPFASVPTPRRTPGPDMSSRPTPALHRCSPAADLPGPDVDPPERFSSSY